MTNEKTLENFNFYRNVESRTTAEEIVEEYNAKHLGRSVSLEDIKFGPEFREGHTFPSQYLQDWKQCANYHLRTEDFDYLQTGFVRDIKKPQSVFIRFGESIFGQNTHPKNLADVLEEIRIEHYLHHLSFEISSRNEHESFTVNLTGIIKSVSDENRSLVKILAYYDNVAGYSHQAIKLIRMVGR